HVVAVARIQERRAPVAPGARSSLSPPHRDPEAQAFGVESQRPVEIGGADGYMMVATPRNDAVLPVHVLSSVKKVSLGEGIPADQSERDANMTSSCIGPSGGSGAAGVLFPGGAPRLVLRSPWSYSSPCRV